LGFDDDQSGKEHTETLDLYWSLFEIMGVSMVDMGIWKWMYDNPTATAEELKGAVVSIAIDVWNKYFADVYGFKDQPILAIYSHIISYPLYLANYSFGNIIEFQIEQYIKEKDFAEETDRIWSIGQLTPQIWMQKAIGEDLTVDPMIDATRKALQELN
jgi:oligoendopeptidase F